MPTENSQETNREYMKSLLQVGYKDIIDHTIRSDEFKTRVFGLDLKEKALLNNFSQQAAQVGEGAVDNASKNTIMKAVCYTLSPNYASSEKPQQFFTARTRTELDHYVQGGYNNLETTRTEAPELRGVMSGHMQGLQQRIDNAFTPGTGTEEAKGFGR